MSRRHKLPLIRPVSRIEQARAILRRWSPRRLYEYGSRAADLVFAVKNLGPSASGRIYCSRLVGQKKSRVEIAIPGCSGPFYLRKGSSDALQVISTFARGMYGAGLVLNREARITVLDAGANIGDSTVWYLNRFRNANVIAIEPDPENFALLQLNCGPYVARSTLLNFALWSEDSPLQLVKEGRDDASSVRAVRSDSSNGSVMGIRMETVVQKFGLQFIDVFKCDIEGAESQVFSGTCGWLDLVGCIYIELHDDRAREQIVPLLAQKGFRSRRHRELYIFDRAEPQALPKRED